MSKRNARIIERIRRILVSLGYQPEVYTDKNAPHLVFAEDIIGDGPNCIVRIACDVENGVTFVRANIDLYIQEDNANAVSAIDDVLSHSWRFEQIGSDGGPCYLLSRMWEYSDAFFEGGWLAGVHEMVCNAKMQACTAIQWLEQISSDVRNSVVEGEEADTHEEYIN